MTWTKLSDDFADDCARVELSDAAFRTHVEGLLWVMRRETGGALDRLAVRRFAEVADPEAAIRELVAAGFWRAEEWGWIVVHQMEHQPEPVVLERRRADTAERVRKLRLKRAALSTDNPGNAVTDPVTERVTRDGTGRDGTGLVPATQLASTTQREEEQHTHARASDDRPTCAVASCSLLARRSCRTCADHMSSELDRRHREAS